MNFLKYDLLELGERERLQQIFSDEDFLNFSKKIKSKGFLVRCKYLAKKLMIGFLIFFFIWLVPLFWSMNTDGSQDSMLLLLFGVSSFLMLSMLFLSLMIHILCFFYRFYFLKRWQGRKTVKDINLEIKENIINRLLKVIDKDFSYNKIWYKELWPLLFDTISYSRLISYLTNIHFMKIRHNIPKRGSIVRIWIYVEDGIFFQSDAFSLSGSEIKKIGYAKQGRYYFIKVIYNNSVFELEKTVKLLSLKRSYFKKGMHFIRKSIFDSDIIYYILIFSPIFFLSGIWLFFLFSSSWWDIIFLLFFGSSFIVFFIKALNHPDFVASIKKVFLYLKKRKTSQKKFQFTTSALDKFYAIKSEEWFYAHYILNPSFQESLVNFSQKTNGERDLYFENNSISFVKALKKDFLEINAKNYLKEKKIMRLYSQIKEIVTLSRELNLIAFSKTKWV